MPVAKSLSCMLSVFLTVFLLSVEDLVFHLLKLVEDAPGLAIAAGEVGLGHEAALLLAGCGALLLEEYQCQIAINGTK